MAYYVVNATNLASIALHRRCGFLEIARAASFHTVGFNGGVGLLLRAPPHVSLSGRRES